MNVLCVFVVVAVAPEVPRHLPKKQRELFLRIQSQENTRLKEEKNQQQRKLLSELKREDSSGSSCEHGKTPSPEPADENWYSSDEEVAEPQPVAATQPAVTLDDPFKIVMSQLNLNISQSKVRSLIYIGVT